MGSWLALEAKDGFRIAVVEAIPHLGAHGPVVEIDSIHAQHGSGRYAILAGFVLKDENPRRPWPLLGKAIIQWVRRGKQEIAHQEVEVGTVPDFENPAVHPKVKAEVQGVERAVQGYLLGVVRQIVTGWNEEWYGH